MSEFDFNHKYYELAMRRILYGEGIEPTQWVMDEYAPTRRRTSFGSRKWFDTLVREWCTDEIAELRNSGSPERQKDAK